jgi:hypothetical protein
MEEIKNKIRSILWVNLPDGLADNERDIAEQILQLISDNYEPKKKECQHEWTDNIIPNIYNEEQCVKCGETRKK